MADRINAIGYLPMTAVLAALTNYESKKGKVKFLEVADTANDYFEDKGLHMTLEDILRALIDLDDADDFAIRYASVDVTGSTKLTSSETSEIQIARSWIGKSDDGKPFLRAVFQRLA